MSKTVNKTIVKNSRMQICSLNLNDFETTKNKFYKLDDYSLIEPITFIDLVLFSPSKQFRS